MAMESSMGSPEETEPEVEQHSLRPGKVLPFVPRRRPDWLTGPSDDVSAAAEVEEKRDAEPGGKSPDGPLLVRPSSPRPAAEPSPELGAQTSGDEAEREASPEQAGPDPPPLKSPTGAWTAAGSSVPVPRLALSTEAEKEDEDRPDEAEAPAGWLPGGDEDRHVAVAPHALAPLHEPWWLIALDALRTDLRVQLAAAGGIGVLALLAYCLWPHGMDATPLSRIRRHPAAYDGRMVTVRGRVGDDVFAVGSGWAYFLVQGRDTIVTFARTRTPRPHEAVTVKGQVSTGFLDGIARQALFEAPPGTK
jgi:hypothetical protein